MSDRAVPPGGPEPGRRAEESAPLEEEA
jgi:hypothetical protein